ncbi:MAG: nucleic acid-binding protein [Methanomicrobiales archaeon]|jgi:hypothetical protein|nr:nucleic acid-binding protein [Methanomicrobiales archaeon]
MNGVIPPDTGVNGPVLPPQSGRSLTPFQGPKRDSTFAREPARRVFAGELREATIHFRDGTEDMSPAYVLLPTGERCNRVFFIGALTDKQRKGEQNAFYRIRVVDPSGTFFVMASSFNQEAMLQISRIEPPNHVAVVGKPNVYDAPDGSKRVSVRAESFTVVEKEVRDLWVLDTAEATLNRLTRLTAEEISGDALRAKTEYQVDPEVYRKMVYDALTQLKI